MAHYIDTSAFMKLVFDEPEAEVFRAWGSGRRVFVSSELLRTEAVRAGRRKSATAVAAVRDALRHVDIVAVSSDLCDYAATLDPLALRSLDAIHLATALALGDDLEGVLTYDQRLADACAEYGLPVIAPGAA